jgi:hypothetical protein
VAMFPHELSTLSRKYSKIIFNVALLDISLEEKKIVIKHWFGIVSEKTKKGILNMHIN